MLGDLYKSKSMEQRTWKANSHSANQEILRLLCNPKVYYRVHKILPHVPILNQMHPIHTLPRYFPTRPKFCILFSSLPCVLRAPPISSSILSH